MIDEARLESIMRRSGAIAMAFWPGAGHALNSWEKKPGDPVSEADLAVNDFLRDQLGALLPAAGWLSEETADNEARLDQSLLWLVDPIDGTRDFVRGRAGWAVSVALVSAGKPLIGMLCAPARDAFYSAIAGRGAYRNGQRLAASQCRELAGARVPVHNLPAVDADLTAVEQPNSIALRIAMVAEDAADLCATVRWGNEWDIGAAVLIAREAGAAVSDALGAPLTFNKRDPKALGVLASAPAIHSAAVDRLATRAEALIAAG